MPTSLCLLAAASVVPPPPLQCSSNASWTFGWGLTDGTRTYLRAPRTIAECCAACSTNNGTLFACGAWTWHAVGGPGPGGARCTIAHRAQWSQHPGQGLTSGCRALPGPKPGPPAPPHPPPSPPAPPTPPHPPPAPPAPPPPPTPPVPPRPPCSLNGDLVRGQCVCDPPWSGPDCETMNFKPLAMPTGYGMTPNKTTWGGNILHDVLFTLWLDPAPGPRARCFPTSRRPRARLGVAVFFKLYSIAGLTGVPAIRCQPANPPRPDARRQGQQYHLFASAMTNGCGLGQWSSNSRIEHAGTKI